MTGKILVTGANRGLGHAIVQCFHDAGWQTAALNRTLRGDNWLIEEHCDLSVGKTIAPAFDAAVAKLGGLDACILNAGVRRLAPLSTMTESDWETSVNVNLTSVFRITQLAIPHLLKSAGHLVLIGSQAADHPFEDGGAYCATKAALHAFAEVLVLETRAQGIRTTLFSAGAIRNRPMQGDDWKIDPAQAAEAVRAVVMAPHNAFISAIEMRPARCLTPPVVGMARLQHL